MIHVSAVIDLPGPFLDELEPLRRNLKGARWLRNPELRLQVWDFGPIVDAQIRALDRILRSMSLAEFDLSASGVGITGAGEIVADIRGGPGFEQLQVACDWTADLLCFKPTRGRASVERPRLELGKSAQSSIIEQTDWLRVHQDFSTKPVAIKGFNLVELGTVVGAAPLEGSATSIPLLRQPA